MKSTIFNEIFDNLLTKYFQPFYKSINTDSNFTKKLENILLQYYIINNNIDSETFLDLDVVFNVQNVNSSIKSSHTTSEKEYSRILGSLGDEDKIITKSKKMSMIDASSLTMNLKNLK
jgi:hypothetical protein